MASELTKRQWTEIIINNEITKQIDLDILQTIYSFEKHRASASQIGRILNGESKMPGSNINLEIGRYAKRIAKHYDINFTERSKQKFKYWDLFFDDGGVNGNLFLWQLKKPLSQALTQSGIISEQQYAEEIPSKNEKLFEGISRTIKVNSYERNEKARQACLKHHGYRCSVCDLSFEEKYGNIGQKFIHVHHILPLKDIRKNYEVNPIKDLRPVCPNCHSMLHKKDPPYSINELKKIINDSTF
jgi:5-methylcytosine-specific restriction protein A